MSTLERRITVGAVVAPVPRLHRRGRPHWGGLVSGRDLAIFAVMYLLVGFGVTVGFHRLLTHRAFEAPPPVRATLAALGSMSVQGAVIHWVADHRKHHTFTDEEGDPHSPAHARRGGLARRAEGPLALAHRLAVRPQPSARRRAASRPTC